jgi:hypothetical protein
MTEADWLSRADPRALLYLLGARAGERKLRLFACACVRRVEHLFGRHADDCRNLLAFAEQDADDRASERAFRAAEAAWAGFGRDVDFSNPNVGACYLAACAAGYAAVGGGVMSLAEGAAARATRDAFYAPGGDEMPDAQLRDDDLLEGLEAEVEEFLERHLVEQPEAYAVFARARDAELAAQCTLLREVVGNPFRRIDLDPAVLAWGDGAVRNLARAIYQERDFARLGILADALEDASCACPGLIDHLRSPGPHVLGCWALDLARDVAGRSLP